MKILLFDKDCLLCNHSVQFVINKDHKKLIKIGALQSELGKKLCSKHHFDSTKLDTMVYLQNDKLLIKSNAVLAVLKDIDSGYGWTSIFKIVPRFIRDALYMMVSKYRYKWFGKTHHCILMNDEIKKRMLSSEDLAALETI